MSESKNLTPPGADAHGIFDCGLALGAAGCGARRCRTNRSRDRRCDRPGVGAAVLFRNTLASSARVTFGSSSRAGCARSYTVPRTPRVFRVVVNDGQFDAHAPSYRAARRVPPCSDRPRPSPCHPEPCRRTNDRAQAHVILSLSKDERSAMPSIGTRIAHNAQYRPELGEGRSPCRSGAKARRHSKRCAISSASSGTAERWPSSSADASAPLRACKSMMRSSMVCSQTSL